MRDIDVRTAVRRRLQALHFGDPNTRIVEEMGIWSGSVRIDIAVINGELRGFELKSDRDTLDRLPMQAQIYSQVFDHVNLVVGSRHQNKAVSLIPDWWGVTVASMDNTEIVLADERKSHNNPSLNAYLIAQLLWKQEAITVLEFCGLAMGWRSKPIKLIHERIATELPLKELRMHVRQMLKYRGQWLGQTVSNQLDMSIDGDLYPLFRVSRRLGSGRDTVNSRVGPAVRKRTSS